MGRVRADRRASEGREDRTLLTGEHLARGTRSRARRLRPLRAAPQYCPRPPRIAELLDLTKLLTRYAALVWTICLSRDIRTVLELRYLLHGF